MSVHWPIIRRCLRSPRRTLVVDDRRAYTAAEILVGALHVASEIERRSASRTVGVMLPCSGAFPIAALGAWMVGRTLVPLNFLLRAEELRYVVEHSEVDLIITAQPLLEAIGDAREWLSPGASLLRMEDVSFKGVPEPRWPARAGADDLATILYTSGTSGKPKGVMLTHGNLATNVRQCEEWVGFTEDEIIVGVLPQFHSFGLTVLTLLPLMVGCRVVYSARFVPQRIVKLFREHRPTAFIALPSMYNALLSVKDAGPEDFASLRYIVSGGEPLSDDVFERVRERFGVRICEGYGLTETSPVTNWNRPTDFRRPSVGMPLPGVRERIVDEASGATLGAGQDGEVRIAGPNVMRGYFKQPELTAEVFDAEGFFRTGDMGRFDDDGHLSITGRIKEMLIIGGENVFPREIEEALSRHPSVKDCGVVGAADGMRGETPVAFVEMEEGAEFNEKELRSWCRERLAGYKVPSDIRRVDALPRNPTGKVLRRELKRMLAQEGAREERPS